MDKPVIAMPWEAGLPITHLPEMDREVTGAGLRLVLLPPGSVEFAGRTESAIIDVNLNAVPHQLAVNSDRVRHFRTPADSMAFYPKDSDFRIRTTNVLPGLVVELDPRKWIEGTALADGQALLTLRYLDYVHDPVAAELGRAGIQLLLEDDSTGAPADQLAIEAIALGLVARVFRRLTAGSRVRPDDRAAGRLSGRKMALATEYVEASLGGTVTVTQLARLLGMSVSSFSVAFSATLGTTPARYVVERRVARARLLLVQLELSVAEVALICGFSNQAHLTRVFKTLVGVTPGAYRKLVRE